MGCGSSQPVDEQAERADGPQTQQQQPKQKQQKQQHQQQQHQQQQQQQHKQQQQQNEQQQQQQQQQLKSGDRDSDGDSTSRGLPRTGTRARRLSYVTANANGGMQPEDPNAGDDVNGGAAAVPAKPPAPGVVASAAPGTQAGSTRARRLSFITNDPNANARVAEPAVPDMEGVDDGTQDEEVVGAHASAEIAARDPRRIMLNVACMSRAGREPGFKKTNQDNCFAFEKYITEDQSLFGALDGHGPNGHLVSGYVKQHLPIILVNHMTTEKNVQKTLTSGFIEVDKSLSNSRIDCEFSGTTAVVAYLKGRNLVTAWVGDSRGVLGRETQGGDIEAIDLTDDHKPTNDRERARILASNGRVERLVDEMGQPMGPFRVWLQYAWIPGLAMSRALGDALAHQVGVSSEPDHSVVDLTEDDRFIILASDGVWEFITSKEAVDIVAQCDGAEEACRQLVDEAYQRWLVEEEGVVDDITAVVVKFIHPK
ncbi:phosphatase 2C-like domain-containing protein [Dunaliella salina]|uniref:Phosphatase 2C-like domain-containing protein n=1 Tax=Dunaliella salina TaxID=3046 RepID=A0ABQ7GQV1_DUNSA|nr:phosphatase 2C-like domain-containing protein [Dunaliella salina]|eukprot:KAF5836988.1 phosphatase 2C-like domain-containing protein [Dunaliella salina]